MIGTIRNHCAARFDDLVRGVSWEFPDVEGVSVAERPDQVLDVLQEVDSAVSHGWWAFGFVAYEAAPALDPTLMTNAPVDGLPLAWFGISRKPVRAPRLTGPDRCRYRLGEWATQWSQREYEHRVQLVRDHIGIGETYQCNLTTRMSAPFCGQPYALYADLALAQEASYSAYLDSGRFVIASASPELFFEWSGDTLHMRPMKGTAPRGRTASEDAQLAQWLLSSEKDRAENIMIVDLIRNDVARLAAPGGVSVRSLCRLEGYPTVYQLTSEVAARLAPRPCLGLPEVFAALFPCGSVTGAPKPSTMRLICDLEETARGVYCGAVGMVAPSANRFRARFSVAIRTAVIDQCDGTLTYGTGSGITWSSEAAAEYAEIKQKAAVLSGLTR